jgi:hypothetical protein
MTPRFRAWSTWTADVGPPTDALALGGETRCLRAAGHVLARLGVPSWADRALVVASVTGDPDRPPNADPLAWLPRRLGDLLRPRSVTAICAGTNTVAMSLIETLGRLHTCDRVVIIVVEPAPAAELAAAFAIENATGRGAFGLHHNASERPETPSAAGSRNPCQAALRIAAALEDQREAVPLCDRWTLAFSWRDAAGHSQ